MDDDQDSLAGCYCVAPWGRGGEGSTGGGGILVESDVIADSLKC